MWLVAAYGIDHFFTGLNTASTGIPRDSSTSQLLQKTGRPCQMANGLDSSFSVFGPMKGAYAIQQSRIVASIPSTSNKVGITVPNEKIAFNFTKAAEKHMCAIGRKIPAHTLAEVIKSPLAIVKDPLSTSKCIDTLFASMEEWKTI